MKNLIERVREILVEPQAAWEKIKSEEVAIPKLFLGYAVPLAAIPAVAMIIGFSLVGVRVPIVGTFRMPLQDSILAAVVAYVLNLAGIYIGGLIINYLATYFNAKQDLNSALKLVVYSATPMWLAQVFVVIPQLSILSLLGLYGLYLFYLGLPIQMEPPSDKAFSYIIVSVIAIVVVSILINVLVSQFIYGPAYSRFSPY